MNKTAFKFGCWAAVALVALGLGALRWMVLNIR